MMTASGTVLGCVVVTFERLLNEWLNSVNRPVTYRRIARQHGDVVVSILDRAAGLFVLNGSAALRGPVVGRKNYYGSGSAVSAELASQVWTSTVTAQRAGLNPLAYLDSSSRAERVSLSMCQPTTASIAPACTSLINCCHAGHGLPE